ncbi:hypothetical protein ACHAWF_014248 [Thalassiosira exigua]
MARNQPLSALSWSIGASRQRAGEDGEDQHVLGNSAAASSAHSSASSFTEYVGPYPDSKSLATTSHCSAATPRTVTTSTCSTIATNAELASLVESGASRKASGGSVGGAAGSRNSSGGSVGGGAGAAGSPFPPPVAGGPGFRKSSTGSVSTKFPSTGVHDFGEGKCTVEVAEGSGLMGIYERSESEIDVGTKAASSTLHKVSPEFGTSEFWEGAIEQKANGIDEVYAKNGEAGDDFEEKLRRKKEKKKKKKKRKKEKMRDIAEDEGQQRQFVEREDWNDEQHQQQQELERSPPQPQQIQTQRQFEQRPSMLQELMDAYHDSPPQQQQQPRPQQQQQQPHQNRSTSSFQEVRRLSAEWNERITAKRRKKKKTREEDEEVPAAVIADAEAAVRSWKEESDAVLLDANCGRGEGESATNFGAEGLAEKREEDEKRRRRYLLLALLLVMLFVVILSLVFGLKKGGGAIDSPSMTAQSSGIRGKSYPDPPTSTPTTVKPYWILNAPVTELVAPKEASAVPAPPPDLEPSPFDEPVIPILETVHPVDLVLDGLPDGYVLPDSFRKSILIWVGDTVRSNLDNLPGGAELVDVSYANGGRHWRRSLSRAAMTSTKAGAEEADAAAASTLRLRRAVVRGLSTDVLPLLFTVRGPADLTELRLRYIVEILRGTTFNLATHLKSLDGEAFENVAISVESDLIEPDGAGAAKMTAAPFPSPTVPPAVNVFDEATATPATTMPSARPVGYPTPGLVSPTPAPMNVQAQGCDADARRCPDGSYVARNPYLDCNFTPCPVPPPPTSSPPSGSPVAAWASVPTEVFLGLATKGPTTSPAWAESVVTPAPATATDGPTTPPIWITRNPTSDPTLGPTLRPTTESPTNDPTSGPSASPTISPTLRPTDTTSLVCVPDSPVAQCEGAPLSLLQKCSSSDTVANDQYGTSVALVAGSDGDVYALIGARHNSVSGSAYLLLRDPDAERWRHTAQFIPGGASMNGSFEGENVAASYDQFGHAVAISEGWAAIAAPFDTASTGRVSMYSLERVTNGGQLLPDVELVPSDISYLDRFGSSLSLDGDVLAVGAVKNRDDVGSAFVYEYSEASSGWEEVDKLAPSDASSDSQGNFGHAIAVAGDVVAVGAPYDSTGGRRRNGAAYVYARSSSGTYRMVQKIVPSELLGGDQFGYSIAVGTSTDPTTNTPETRIVIGARFRDDAGMDSGSVYVYVRRSVGGQFTFEQRLAPIQWSERAEFGSSVDLYERALLVGAKGKGGVGGAYYFQYDGTSWISAGSLAPSSRSNGGAFGTSVALASGAALVGSDLDGGAGENSGSIYSYAMCD